jgi:hypothetical protein
MPEDLAFVNVGVWHGFTFFAGLVNNYRKICIGIDNFSEFGGPREAFAEKFQRYKSDTHHFYDMDYREYFRSVHKGPIGFYIYDAEHSYQNQLTGLQVAEPFFAENCIVLVDDTNWLEPRQATLDFIAASQYEYEILFESSTCCPNNPSDMITELRYNPTWWNGIMLLQKGSKKASKQPNTRSMGESKSQIESRSGLRDESVRDQAPRRTSWKAEMGGEWERSGTEGPLVSIVISSHNDGHVLQKAIDSALDQTYPDIEVVVPSMTHGKLSPVMVIRSFPC